MKSILYKMIITCILIFTLITLFSGCTSLKEGKHKTSVTRSMNTNEEWTDTSITPYPAPFIQGDSMRFNYKSTVKSGALSLKLVDSKGNLIYEFDTGKKGKKDIEIVKTDIYELAITGNEFTGSYEVTCNSLSKN